ncbi:hypothetical protein [Rhodococcus ruber]|uniref:hypothetical protein n=1 Tax=Rhodococcus ruber TaxID=1830 RepID=UPI001F32BFF1|nr:hypothetical protein [Rhodococcus ruber]MCF8784371.1 hypothetical protein [Rhodococcus ruber]
MTSKARRALTGLAAVAIVLIVGGLMFDRHGKQTYTECMDEARDYVSESYKLPGVYDPDQPYIDTMYVYGCDEAGRGGLLTASLGAVLLVAAALGWWARRREGRS